jgi:acyl-CoA dehydrogenase
MFAWLAAAAKARDLVPRMSATEREALEAGTVWVEGELFSGRPDFARILREPYPQLTSEEQAFLDGPVEEVCRMVNEWELNQAREFPPEVLRFLRKHGFFGLVIPKEYGGRAFSALGCSAVFGKLTSRSLALSSLVLIPNSVGPAELIAAYGTKDQKDGYLPRLASGEDIPCFALTEPHAGSDAAAMRSRGVVFAGTDGRLYLRLDFQKRYITLAPIATLIGVAVKVQDPRNLLGKGEDVGITCVLVPASAKGVEIGRRHDPMGVFFPNGPIDGRDVVVPVDEIIGGPAWAGRGWQMLMEALSGGRGVSLPGQSAAGVRLAARGAGAYAVVRQQFGMPIGRFEGIEEPLARIAGTSYLLDAVRVFTCGAVDSGKKPSVVSAIAKYHATEALRRVLTDAMDVFGGAGICVGPRNLLARGYTSAPVGITVEGANILTRTLIIYGQGAIRCHPYAQQEIAALARGDGDAFVGAVVRHFFFLLRNLVRSAFLGLTRGGIASSPVSGPTARYYRRLAWASATFATLSDLAMITQGSRLKQRGKLTGRFADALSWMYLGLATLRRYEAEGRRPEDLPLVQWAAETSLAQVQTAFEGIRRNFDAPVIGWLLRGPVALVSRLNPVGTPPSDRLGARVARLLTTAGPVRERLGEGLYIPTDPQEAVGRLERAFRLVTEAAPVIDKIRQATQTGRLPKGAPEALTSAARKAGIIERAEAALVCEAAAAREDAIQVDSFSLAEYQRRDPVDAEPQAVTAGR